MDKYGEQLKKYIQENGIECQFLVFDHSCHSVEESAKTVNALPQDIAKNICMIDPKGDAIVTIVRGDNKISTKKVKKVLNLRKLRFATDKEMIEKTGYPAVGIPSFGYSAEFLIDQNVMKKEIAYTGAGSENCLVRISTKELQKANRGLIVDIRR